MFPKDQRSQKIQLSGRLTQDGLQTDNRPDIIPICRLARTASSSTSANAVSAVASARGVELCRQMSTTKPLQGYGLSRCVSPAEPGWHLDRPNILSLWKLTW